MKYLDHVKKFVWIFLLFASCSHKTSSVSRCATLLEQPYFLVIAVHAKHLDYSDGSAFLRSFFNTEDARFGHAWCYLKGKRQDRPYVLVGGHSGESDPARPTYLDQIIEAAKQQCKDPLSILYDSRDDGYFEWGSGGYHATYAIYIPLDYEQFHQINTCIQEYSFSEYNLVHSQCSAFAARLASLAGCVLQHTATLRMPKTILFDGKSLTLWHNPMFSSLTVSTPDVLEKSMKQAVQESRAFFIDPYLLQSLENYRG